MLDTNQLLKKDKIVFGPFVGEFGWEVQQWSGFIRWVKLNNPDKKIVVSTRWDRQDLYSGCVDYLELFKLDGDYIEYFPENANHPNLPPEMYNEISNHLKSKYDDYFFVNPRAYNENNLFNIQNMNFEYTPNPINTRIIESILNNSENKIPILISPVDKKTMMRNWGTGKWKLLFDILYNSDKYCVFVTGISPNYYKALDYRKNFYNIEDFSNYDLNATITGLTIEAIRKSKLVVSVQSGVIILANLLKKQNMFWGDNVKKYSITDNPYKTKSFGVEDYTYCIDPSSVYQNMKKIIDM